MKCLEGHDVAFFATDRDLARRREERASIPDEAVVTNAVKTPSVLDAFSNESANVTFRCK